MTAASAPPTHPRHALSPRAVELAEAARILLEDEGADALTMRSLADRVGIKAPSIYKHFANKESLETVLVEDALVVMGTACHEAVANPGRFGPIAALGRAYRTTALATPNLYRLVTRDDFPRADIAEGLEEWAGSPFRIATGDPYEGQALWAFTHGMVILEIDQRFADASGLDRTWARGLAAFESLSSPT